MIEHNLWPSHEFANSPTGLNTVGGCAESFIALDFFVDGTISCVLKYKEVRA